MGKKKINLTVVFITLLAVLERGGGHKAKKGEKNSKVYVIELKTKQMLESPAIFVYTGVLYLYRYSVQHLGYPGNQYNVISDSR